MPSGPDPAAFAGQPERDSHADLQLAGAVVASQLLQRRLNRAATATGCV